MSVQTFSEMPSRNSAAGFSHPRPTRSVGLRLLSVALVVAFVGWAGAQAQQKAAPRAAVVPEEQFDQWIFQQDRNASGARRRLDSLLALQVEDIERACELTDVQKKKLQLTGRGDIKRFFDRYEKVKQKFQAIKHDQQKLQEIWQDINPLQMTLQVGLFHDDSLLVKSLHHTLTGEQFTRYEAMARERRVFRHRATIELAVSTLEQNMPLRAAQRRELFTLLLNQTKPSRKPGYYDYQLILFQIGRLPEEKLKPLFDDLQWKVVNQHLGQFKGLEPLLKQSGQWPVEDDEADRTDGRPATLKK